MDLNKLLSDASVDAILITDPYNLRYYTGFRGGEGFGLITNRGSFVLITDSRYTEAAEKECFTGFVVRTFNSSVSIYDILSEYIAPPKFVALFFFNILFSI